MPTPPADAPLTVLLIDDEQTIHDVVGRGLTALGFAVVHAHGAEEGLRSFREQKIDVVISDIRMPGMDGLELVGHLRQLREDVEVVLITGHVDVENVVAGIREGASDFLAKPIDLDELFACLQRTRRYQQVKQEKARVEQHLEALLRSDRGRDLQAPVVGDSQVMREVLGLVDKVAQADQTTVLVEGESGTGKELVARAVHRASRRAERPFVSLNCTAIPESLLESELFGHEAGAFTDARKQRQGLFELANGGTLFLDEIGDMPLAAQARLLRVLEERQVRRLGGKRDIAVDVRIVTATHRDLQALVDEGRFRGDLYFRVNVFRIVLPPLRERGNDVLLLADHYVSRYAAEMGKAVGGIEPAARQLLLGYGFPGNVRELRNLIERAVILCDGPVLRAQDVGGYLLDAARESPSTSPSDLSRTRSLNLDQMERSLIEEALRRARGKQVLAAEYLGIQVFALRYRMKKHGLRPQD